MAFIKPQLASPEGGLADGISAWVMEEKFDGHRLIVEVEAGLSNLLSEAKRVTAWSRNGKRRVLPRHLEDALGWLPVGIFDGELLVPGQRSYGVTELVNSDRLAFVCFDLLEVNGDSVRDLSLRERRAMLEFIFQHPVVAALTCLRVAEQRPCVNVETVEAWRDEIWARDGEGLILKRATSRYVAGKRSKDWVKIKQLRTAVLTVTGWQASRGKINDRGKFACAVIVDDKGHETTVKTRDDDTIATLEAEARKTGRQPFLGRRLRIEYQERTPDGNYRHPRWDRWENE